MVWTRGEQRNPAEPEEGYYAVRLVKKGPEVGARIGKAVTPDYMMTAWFAVINGEESCTAEDPELNELLQKVWLFGRKIDESKYRYLMYRCAWYKTHMPDHPYAHPEKPIDDTARRMLGPMED